MTEVSPFARLLQGGRVNSEQCSPNIPNNDLPVAVGKHPVFVADVPCTVSVFAADFVVFGSADVADLVFPRFAVIFFFADVPCTVSVFAADFVVVGSPDVADLIFLRLAVLFLRIADADSSSPSMSR